MKKLFFFLMMMILTTGIVGCSSEGASSGEASENGETIVLRASSGLPSDQVWQEPLFLPWMKKVEEESDGRVKFDYYSNAELVDLGGELDALKAGTIDVALPIMHLYDPKRFPLSEITMIPLTNSDAKIANEAYHQLVYSDRELKDGKTFYELEMEMNGVKAWPVTVGYPYVLNTTGKKFGSPEDFKNMRFRVSSRINEMFITNVGASPISMSQNDTYDALSRGALDGTIMPIGDWTTWGFQDQLTYAIQEAHIGHFSAVFGMTEDKWNSLPKDIQEIMNKAAQELSSSEETVQYINDREQVVFDEVDGKAEFGKLSELNTDTREHIVKAMDETWLEWIDLIEKQGAPGKEVAMLWRDLIIDAGGDVPAQIKELK